MYIRVLGVSSLHLSTMLLFHIAIIFSYVKKKMNFVIRVGRMRCSLLNLQYVVVCT